MNEYLLLAVFAVVAFVQNMAFTWSSRSRASGDPAYHRYASIFSNGIWFVCQVLIMKQIWTSVQSGEWWAVATAGVIYTVATSEGSVCMMRWLIKHEKGKRRVGSY